MPLALRKTVKYNLTLDEPQTVCPDSDSFEVFSSYSQINDSSYGYLLPVLQK